MVVHGSTLFDSEVIKCTNTPVWCVYVRSVTGNKEMKDGNGGQKRQSNCRYAFEIELRYKIASEGRPNHEGTGRTISLSSDCVLFEADNALPVGVDIELFIPWPSRRHTATPSMLCITGKIIRVRRKQVAVEVLHYDYRLHCRESKDSEQPLKQAG